jgi:hypothetical protein
LHPIFAKYSIATLGEARSYRGERLAFVVQPAVFSSCGRAPAMVEGPCNCEPVFSFVKMLEQLPFLDAAYWLSTAYADRKRLGNHTLPGFSKF